MKYTAGQAAKVVGVSTPTISRALKSGKISGVKNESGAWRIDASELHRVDWGVSSKDDENPNMKGTVPPLKDHENKLLEPLVEALQEQIRDLRADRDGRISDLQQERDHWREEAQAMRLLLSNGGMPARAGQGKAVGGFWARLWGKTVANG